MVDVVIDEGGEEVVGGADGVEVAGEMQVDVFHRQYLRVAAASCTALDAEDGAERGFAHGDDGFFAETVQGVGKADGDRGFAFACRCRVDGGDEDKFARLVARARADFGFVFAVVFEFVGADADFGGDGVNGLHGGLAGNVGVGHG